MTDESMELLQRATDGLETAKGLLSTVDWRISRGIKDSQQKERLLSLREQVGKAFRETEKAHMWAREIVALEAGRTHPGSRSKRSFGSTMKSPRQRGVT